MYNNKVKMMKQQTESCVPPGFRFHPTDEELVGYYLRKKVAAQKIDLDVIKDIDLYRIEPWDLPEKCRIGYEEEKEWYFFSHKDKKYPTGTRTNRATIAGFWKATGRDKAVYDHGHGHHHAKSSNNVIIGMRKTLVFYRGRAPNGHKTDWIMHEYRLESQENSSLQEEGWVVCRAFKKRATTGQQKNTETWDARNFSQEPTTNNNSVMNPNDCMITWQQQNFLTQNFLCKQESTSTTSNLTTINNSFINSDSFVHLPPLANPSLLPERNSINKVTDWRSLDKFVASQLSHVDHNEDLNSESLGHLQMQIGRGRMFVELDNIGSWGSRDTCISSMNKYDYY